uniref:FHA domain-containing protein n=1 Tax=Rhizochromulina marina TaxID=1034831 RepID=A0A7S2RKJ0_9STRA|mmetsp:Transcript_17549/g.51362  ORF Transcript_17549/g.51362 Transcript_17549/m.51362 type:complete len:352 (+) Transcript_17549:3-1058(+)
MMAPAAPAPAGECYAALRGWVIEKDGNDCLKELPATRIDAFIHHLRCTLGRTPTAGDDRAPESLVPLSEKKLLSRHHAEMRWEPEEESWVIQCLSKNGMHVNRVFYSVEDPAVPIKSGAAIRLGPCYFYFCLPLAEEPNGKAPTTGRGNSKYWDMIVDAFDRADCGSTGITKAEIVAICEEQNPEYSDVERRRNLVNSIGVQLNKRARKVNDGSVGARARWVLDHPPLSSQEPPLHSAQPGPPPMLAAGASSQMSEQGATATASAADPTVLFRPRSAGDTAPHEHEGSSNAPEQEFKENEEEEEDAKEVEDAGDSHSVHEEEAALSREKMSSRAEKDGKDEERGDGGGACC